MRTRKKREGGYIAIARIKNALPYAGAYVYSGLVALVGAGALWFAVTLSTAGTFAEIRPALSASLGSLSAYFGGAEPAVILAIEAPGQIVALNDFDVAAKVSGKVVSIVAQGDVVKEGDLIARFDDSTARATLRSAEAEVAAARVALADVQKEASAPTPTSDAALADAFEAGYTALSNAHINFVWIFSSTDGVMNGKDIKDSQPNSLAYVSLIGTEYPEIRDLRDKAAEDLERATALYTKARAQYEGMTRSSTPAEIESAMNATYTVLGANADALKSIGVFLTAVREQHEEAGLTIPEPLSSHQQSIMDAQVTTNDNIEAVRNTRDNLASIRAEAAVPAPVVDIGSYERALADAQKSVLDARVNLERYEVRAPIGGTIASVTVPQGSAALDGQILASILTSENVARVAVSEADISNVHAGDAAEVRFDGAGFTLAGTVLSVDTVATVSEGTVRFMAFVGFNEEDARVRPGMSVTARIAK